MRERPRLALTSCRRAQLVGYPPSRPRASFLHRLRRLDHELECHWVPDRWVLYRRLKWGATPAGDRLLKEVDLAGPRGEYRPLGDWVLDWLRAHDKTAGGAVDPKYATRAYLRGLKEADDNWDRAQEERIRPAANETAKDLWTYAVKNKRHITVARKKVRKR